MAEGSLRERINATCAPYGMEPTIDQAEDDTYVLTLRGPLGSHVEQLRTELERLLPDDWRIQIVAAERDAN